MHLIMLKLHEIEFIKLGFLMIMTKKKKAFIPKLLNKATTESYPRRLKKL